MSRKIVVTSGKGGVGKTTFCANIGTSLARTGAKVCLMDLDMGLNNLDVAMDIESRVLYDIVDVAQGKCRVMQALVQDGIYSTLYTLPSSQSFARHNVTGERLAAIIKVLEGVFDFIIIDCPAGIDDGFYKAANLASEAILVVNSHIYSLRDAGKVVSILLSLGFNKIGLVVNRVRADLLAANDMLSPQAASELLKCQLLGIVPDDDCFAGQTLAVAAAGRRAQEAFDLLAQNILSGDNKIYDISKKRAGFLAWLKRRAQ